MGDRFVVVRMDSATSARRASAGQQARKNTGQEAAMRSALTEAVGGLLAHASTQTPLILTDAEAERLDAAADLVTLARTGVDYDYRGDVIDAHAPEMPTRFTKQLVQLLRGGCAIGLARAQALRLAIRCARDSMPPLRLAILDDLAAAPHSSTREVRQRLNKPYTTVDRQLQALHMLGVLECDELKIDEAKSRWYYRLAQNITPNALSVPDLLPPIQRGT
jgi:hypothetical protein